MRQPTSVADTNIVRVEKLMNCKHTREDSCWEYDGQGIPLARVCYRCVEHVLSKYNPVVLGHYDQSDVDEPINEE
jgi:hypothetical protein